MLEQNMPCDPWVPQAPSVPTFAGRVIHVPNSPGSIQAAIDSVETNDGDTLLLDSTLGVYSVQNQINIYKRIRLASKDPSAPATVSGCVAYGLISVQIDGVLIENLTIANASTILSGSPIVLISTYSGVHAIRNCKLIGTIICVSIIQSFIGMALIDSCDFTFNTNQFQNYGVTLFGRESFKAFVINCKLFANALSGQALSFLASFQCNQTAPFEFVTSGCTNASSPIIPSRGFLLIESLSTLQEPLASIYVDQTSFNQVAQSAIQIRNPSQIGVINLISVTDSQFTFGALNPSVRASPIVTFTGSTSGNTFPTWMPPPTLYFKNAQLNYSGPLNSSFSVVSEFIDQVPPILVNLELAGYLTSTFVAPSQLVPARTAPTCRALADRTRGKKHPANVDHETSMHSLQQLVSVDCAATGDDQTWGCGAMIQEPQQ